MLGKDDLLKQNVLQRQELKGIRGELDSKLCLLIDRMHNDTIDQEELTEQLISIYNDLYTVRVGEFYLDAKLQAIALIP